VRSFEGSTRSMLELSAAPDVKGRSHLPIIADKPE
jgi:3-deoxy-7-phosphoheptulonate synthase